MSDIDEVLKEIKDTKAEIAEAKREGDVSRRDRLEAYLIERQKEKNLLFGQKQETCINPPNISY